MQSFECAQGRRIAYDVYGRTGDLSSSYTVGLGLGIATFVTKSHCSQPRMSSMSSISLGTAKVRHHIAPMALIFTNAMPLT